MVLFAPGKESVFILGDFNNWIPSVNYQMKKDGDRFWINIPNLISGKQYAFQYLVDENIRIADPYTEIVLDPWNDKYIPQSVYPNIPTYPTRADGITSVLHVITSYSIHYTKLYDSYITNFSLASGLNPVFFH